MIEINLLCFIGTYCSLPPKYIVSITDKEHETTSGVENCRTKYQPDRTQLSDLGMIQPSEQQPFLAPVIGNERVTASDHWQDVRLLTFNIAGSHIT